jgi:excisionase family DNA binding protein
MLGNERDYSKREEGYVMMPLLTVAEAAKFLGVGRKIVYQLIEWGELKVVKVDGSAMIEKRSLEEYKSSGKLS